MTKILEDVKKIVFAIVALSVKFDELTDDAKKEVCDKLLAIIDEEGGIDIPKWARAILPTLLPIVVPIVFNQMEKSGFFEEFEK